MHDMRREMERKGNEVRDLENEVQMGRVKLEEAQKNLESNI